MVMVFVLLLHLGRLHSSERRLTFRRMCTWAGVMWLGGICVCVCRRVYCHIMVCDRRERETDMRTFWTLSQARTSLLSGTNQRLLSHHQPVSHRLLDNFLEMLRNICAEGTRKQGNPVAETVSKNIFFAVGQSEKILRSSFHVPCVVFFNHRKPNKKPKITVIGQRGVKSIRS